ncbi:hypothetical protein FHR24_001580 [Wenyingzhuangia heitensis]|uniref:HTH HARE-type domain-containing protein n=1 Tax=Wenyingzhuangia heitensis TaxID=1487859 RepID=A0ABX0UC65_9FLAO|nr:hypothetical protein [Wenyingzhuangia heitensis]NIJ45141.1 hypothetical protein [Wenyingzhuangia heitensis]
MTIKEAILKSLSDIGNLTNSIEVCQHIIKHQYYNFKEAKTPPATVSALLGDFIRNGDSRIKRIKGKNGTFSYYLTKNETEIGVEVLTQTEPNTKRINKQNTYAERDLHLLLSTYLKSNNTYAKTIFHEQSKSSSDSHQKWIHPDVIGINFLNLQSKASQTLLKAVNRADVFKITSYEVKKEINTDYELKKTFFQAVSNSSWANYGYLVAFEIADSLYEEMERLNQSFGIGVIELKSNPYESKVLFSSKFKELDFKTIDKLCKINTDFEKFIIQTEKLLTANEKYIKSTEKELESFCDSYFESDSEIEEYCRVKKITNE